MASTWDPVNSQKATLSNANLTYASTGNAAPTGAIGTTGKSSGLWYWELVTTGAGAPVLGIYKSSDIGSLNSPGLGSATSWGYLGVNGTIFNNGAASITGLSTWTTETIGWALDMTNGFLYAAVSNAWQNGGVPTSGASGTGAIASGLAGTFYPGAGPGNATAISVTANFGATSFTYTPPAGFGGFDSVVQNPYNRWPQLGPLLAQRVMVGWRELFGRKRSTLWKPARPKLWMPARPRLIPGVV